MSEVRKAQTYGRDPRNGHSTIYCISKAGTIYQASEPMYELLMQNMRALEQVGRGETCDRRDDSPTKADAGPARRQPRAERSRACSSRPCIVVGAEPAVRRRRRGAGRASSAGNPPCVVVGAEPAVHRRGRGSDHAAPGRPPRPTSPLRRRSPRRSRLRDVLRRASGAQFLIARRGRGSGRRSTASTTARSRVPLRAARRPSTASCRTSPRPPRAVLLRCSAFFHQVGINVRRRRARRSTTSMSSRAPLTRWPLWRGSCTRSWPWASPTSDASKMRMIRDPYSSCL